MVERFAVLGHLDGVAASTVDAASAPTLDASESRGQLGAPRPHDAARRYTFEAVFAQGGLGRIRRAFDHRLQRHVAVKELQSFHPGSAAEARFYREVLLTARLEHPAIVPIQDLGNHPAGEPYYCMKLVDGQSLDALVRARPSLSDRLALLPHVMAVADALAYAHDRGVIHRDLKPANVLVGAFGETVVIDWGLAKDLRAGDSLLEAPSSSVPAAAHADLTRTGEFMGTLPFMPPEQAEGDHIDARADVYAIGAVLYFVLSGHMPYERPSALEILHALLAGPPPELGELVTGLPLDLLAIVHKSMARDPTDRYPSAKELVADLRRFEAGRLVTARPYSPLDVLRHYARRYRAVLTAVAAGVLLLIVVGAYSYWQVVQQKREADDQRDVATAARSQAEASERDLRATANQLLLTNARGALDEDLAEAVRSLGQVELTDPATARRARLIALAADARGAPARVLRGHSRPIRQLAAIADGGLVSVDVGGGLWTWDPVRGEGQQIHDFAEANVELVTATRAPVWAAVGSRTALVVRADDSREELDVSAVPGSLVRPFHAFEWQLSANGESLAAVGTGTTMQGEPPGHAAYVWDLLPRPATARALTATRAGPATLSPDGRAIAYADDHRRIVLWRDDTEAIVPGLRAPVAFSADGEHLIATDAEWPRRHHAWPLAGGAARPLGHWTLAIRDDAVLVLEFGGEAELSLRTLATGETRWSESFRLSGGPRDWTGPVRTHDIKADPHGDGLALRTLDAWQLGTWTDGRWLRRLDVGLYNEGIWAVGGHFALAHDMDLWIWDAGTPSPTAASDLGFAALAPESGRAIAYTRQGSPPRLWDLATETFTPAACLADVSTEQIVARDARVALDRNDRVLFVGPTGVACLGDRAGSAKSLTFAGKPTAVALAGVSPAFAVALEDGAVHGFHGPDAPPQRWTVDRPVSRLVAMPVGDAFVAHTRGGEVVALRIGVDAPAALVTVDPGGRSAARIDSINTVAHPSQAIAAVLVPDEDLLLLHDFTTGQSERHTLLLPPQPVAAYSPAGSRLATATGGSSIVVLSAAEGMREVPLPEGAGGLAFISEDELAVLGERGSLFRVDLTIDAAAVLSYRWNPNSDALMFASHATLAATPSGAVVAWDRGNYTVFTAPADAVPGDASSLATWLRVRADAMHGG